MADWVEENCQTIFFSLVWAIESSNGKGLTDQPDQPAWCDYGSAGKW